MFYLHPSGNYRSTLLDGFDWLEYGFGTRGARWPEKVATLHQVHSDVAILANGRTGCLGEGDALLTNTPGALVGVKTADCLPILLSDSVHRAAAVVHAGWRGTARRIACRAIAEMRRHFGTAPADLHAVVGPGIGVCCYEVGPEVAAEFGSEGRVHLDLAAVNRTQLVEIGIPATQIEVAGLCTACRAEFWSFRRDKQGAGRMLSFAGVRERPREGGE